MLFFENYKKVMFVREEKKYQTSFRKLNFRQNVALSSLFHFKTVQEGDAYVKLTAILFLTPNLH